MERGSGRWQCEGDEIRKEDRGTRTSDRTARVSSREKEEEGTQEGPLVDTWEFNLPRMTIIERYFATELQHIYMGSEL